ncbi:acetylornithine deacetylase [Buchnera aphidicola (Nipponaphis monzeni)]|uniref:Acetylornithine deacetylase n=1 Tax=Buchnera aphidicola (Nipponaphis monzeni) TaxID=2495405 RepID=A0A455T9R7_9GAMM|nr:acetylornithine deacetylase [Buchnera aphidicola]BBI01055.1 acetylornithine deacetylase [Buchnera aphidicola (Nipponaphis monzeni)]
MNYKIPLFLEIFTSLIQTPSISSTIQTIDMSNKNFIDLLSNYFNDLDFFVKLYKVPHTINKFNMLASKTVGNRGGLLLSGHTDTVPYDDNLWDSDPFILTNKNNKYYGLGVVDMKGFFAIVLETLKYICFKKLKRSIHILATADEETTMSGAIHFTNNTCLKPDCIIIGEPTSLIPVISHKGHMSISVMVKGQSGHSSNPSLGINSIDIMYDVISKLLQLRTFFKKKYMYNGFNINYPTLNLGKIYGGDSANRICSSCTLLLDIRYTPNIDTKTINILILKYLNPIINKWPQRLEIKKIHEDIPSYYYKHSNIFLKKIENIVNKSSIYADYCTEASFLQKIGPTIILGPGSINQAHQNNEFIDQSYISITRNILWELINYFCL